MSFHESLSKTRTRRNSRLCGSKGSDVASATTITLGDEGNYFDITGTTAIVYITTTNWTAGSIITLQFDDAVALTISGGAPAATSAAILAGAFTTATGDTLTLIYTGAVWQELSRMVA
jgi:hypothetical protein